MGLFCNTFRTRLRGKVCGLAIGRKLLRCNEIRVALIAAPRVVDVAIPWPADLNCHVFAVRVVRLCDAHESGQDIDVSAAAYALGEER